MKRAVLTGRRRLALALGLAAAVLVPGATLADTIGGYGGISAAESDGATVVLAGQPSLMNRAVLTVGITFTCEPLDVVDLMTGETIQTSEGYLESANVTVVQANGKTLVSGTSYAIGGTVVCDGSTVNRGNFVIVPQTGLFKRGAAVAGASVNITDAGMMSSHHASTGPISISIGK